jgi:LacI family transcriptional regulator
MGETACELLLRSIGGDTRVYREIVPQQLVIRETSARNKQN